MSTLFSALVRGNSRVACLSISSYNRGMKLYRADRWAFFCASLSLFLLLPSLAVAGEPAIPTGAFVVRPAKLEIALPKGGSETRMLTLTNGTALPLAVRISFEDIAPQTQTSPVDDPVALLGSAVGTHSLKDFISTKEERLTILSGQVVEVPITVRIPATAGASGHYGSVVLSFSPVFSGDAAKNESVVVESRLATLFFVRVLGEVKEEGRLVEFGLFNNAQTTPSPKEGAPLRFQIAYENTGSVHLNPYGLLTVTSMFGKTKTEIIDPWVVLPDGVRMREINVHDALSVGYYTATLEQNRGYGDIVDARTVHFWVIPTGAQWVMILFGCLFLLWLLRKSLSISKHFVS